MATLSGTGSLATGWQTLRAPPGTVLYRSKWYYLVLEGPTGTTSTLRIATTDGDGEHFDSDDPGWKVGNDRKERNAYHNTGRLTEQERLDLDAADKPDELERRQETFSSQSDVILIRVNGRELVEVPEVRPGWSSASGNQIALIYRHQSGLAVRLDRASVPSVGAYDVRVDGNRVNVTNVGFSYSQVNLTLAQSVPYGSEVRVSYDKPSRNLIQDTDGDEAESFSNVRIANRSPRPASLPPPGDHVWWDATMTAGLSGSNVVGYNRNLGTGSLSPGSFQEGGTTRQVSSLTVNSTNQLLGLAFQGEVPEARRNRMVLRVGGRSFRLEDATFRQFGGESTFTWTNSGLSWSAGDRVDAYLTEPDSAPRFTGHRSVCFVNEHVARGTKVCEQPASDPEGGAVTYRLEGKDARFYRVDADGNVRTDVPAAEFDYETRDHSIVCRQRHGGRCV